MQASLVAGRGPSKLVTLSFAGALLLAACAETPPLPVLLPQEKLVLQPSGDRIRRDDLEVRVGGQMVARSPTYQGLASYVRCVPRARTEAAKATRYGKTGRFLSYAGTAVFWSSLAFGAFGNAFAVLSGPDCGHLGCAETILTITNSMVIGVTLGKIMELLGSDYQGTAHGRVQNAVNLYNDSLGTLGAGCEDLRDAP